MNNPFAYWQSWAALAALFAALTAVFGKIGVSGLNPDFATLIRTCIILAFLVMVVAATGAAQPLHTIAPRTLLFIALSGLATGLSWLCYYRALSMGPAAQVAPVDKLSVVLVALIATGFLGEHLSLRNWVGVGLVFVGTILAAMKG